MHGFGFSIWDIARRGAGVAEPAIIFSGSTIAENASLGALIGTLSIGNAIGNWLDPITYTLLDSDGNRVAIDGDDVERGAVALDFETHPLLTFEVEADNGTNTPITSIIMIPVTDVDDTAPTITSANSTSVVENAQLAWALTANESVTWSIRTVGQDGASVDHDKFEISGSTLRWVGDGAKDYDSPTDTGLNNTYVVVIRATDGNGNTSDQTFTATVTDIDDTAPTITSSNSVANTEGNALAHSLTANETVTWSIIGGADALKFEINGGSTLRWAANGVKDHGSPDDSDLNNTYIVQVLATDTASNTSNQTITVTVQAIGGGATAGEPLGLLLALTKAA